MRQVVEFLHSQGSAQQPDLLAESTGSSWRQRSVSKSLPSIITEVSSTIGTRSWPVNRFKSCNSPISTVSLSARTEAEYGPRAEARPRDQAPAASRLRQCGRGGWPAT